MGNKKGEVGFMAIKIYLEKAYDRLRWEFIRDTLIEVSLPDDLVNIICHCISSVSM